MTESRPPNFADLAAEDIDSELLMRRVLEGEDSVYEQLVERYFERARRYAAVHLGSNKRADDAALAALAEAFEALKRGRRPPTPFRAWLLGHVRVQALKLRGVAAPRRATDDMPVRRHLAEAVRDGATPPVRASSHASLLAGIDALPIGQREALFLRFQAGHTVRELAKIMGITPRAASLLLKRALAALEQQPGEGKRSGTGTRSEAEMSRRERSGAVVRARRLALDASKAGVARKPGTY